MPPEAISRSSTYLPKSCGNTLNRHVSALVLVWLVSGCEPAPLPDTELPVELTQLADCPVPDADLTIELEALGDFPPTNLSYESLEPTDEGARLRFPAATRLVRARATESDSAWQGVGLRRDQDATRVLLWPETEACRLFRPKATDAYPGLGGGQAIGFHPGRELVLIAGGDAGESAAVIGALTFDTARGQTSLIDVSERNVLLEARAFATASAFGEKLVVAGGEDPLIRELDEAERALRDTAEVYDPDLGEFELEPIQLRLSRSRHAALSLASGDVLLVGGRSEGDTALCPLEVIDAADRVSKLAGATLEFCRIDPVALALSDGRILVGGGETPADEAVEVVSELEWLDASAAHHVKPNVVQGLPGRFDRAFVAMPGGSALAVGGCENREPNSAEEASSCEELCTRGCAPLATPCEDDSCSVEWDAWWITANGELERLPALSVPAPHPVLIPGTDGSPWLVAGARGEALLRFNPWRGEFEAVPNAPAHLPSAHTWTALDPGAFVWISELGERAEVFGYRFDTRSAFAQDIGLGVQTQQDDPLWPLHLAPDRPSHESSVSYDGNLRLDAGSIWVTDATFADFEAEITLESGEPPALRLGSQLIDAPECAWPDGKSSKLEVERRAGTLTLHRGSASSAACVAAEGPVAFGLTQSKRAKSPTSIGAIQLNRLNH
jgi:hypothetical protein